MVASPMQNALERRGRLLEMGCLALLSIACLSMLAYWIALQVDLNTCYARVGKSLDTGQTFDAVESALIFQVQKDVRPGMTRAQALAGFAKIAPALVVQEWSLPEGETKDLVKLGTCFFVQNDIEFLAIYSNGRLESVRRYVDD